MINHPYSDLRDGDYVSYTIEGAALAGTPGRIVEILPTGNAIVRWNSGATSTSPLARLVRRMPGSRNGCQQRERATGRGQSSS